MMTIRCLDTSCGSFGISLRRRVTLCSFSFGGKDWILASAFKRAGVDGWLGPNERSEMEQQDWVMPAIGVSRNHQSSV